jgi:hypothetical protein
MPPFIQSVINASVEGVAPEFSQSRIRIKFIKGMRINDE